MLGSSTEEVSGSILSRACVSQIIKTHEESQRRRAFECIRQCRLFSKWSSIRLQRVAGLLRFKQYASGETVIKQVVEHACVRGRCWADGLVGVES